MDDVIGFRASRRSVRKYLPRPLQEQTVRQLLEAGRLAPSRANSQPWRFIVLTDPAIKRELYEAAHRQDIVVSAPLLIAVLGVIDLRQAVPARSTELVTAGAFGEKVKRLADHVLDDWSAAEFEVDAALNSSIAATHMMLAAHGLGLGCCRVKLCRDEAVLRVLGVPDGYYKASILAIGDLEERRATRPRVPLGSLVYKERFGQRPTKPSPRQTPIGR